MARIRVRIRKEKSENRQIGQVINKLVKEIIYDSANSLLDEILNEMADELLQKEEEENSIETLYSEWKESDDKQKEEIQQAESTLLSRIIPVFYTYERRNDFFAFKYRSPFQFYTDITNTSLIRIISVDSHHYGNPPIDSFYMHDQGKLNSFVNGLWIFDVIIISKLQIQLPIRTKMFAKDLYLIPQWTIYDFHHITSYFIQFGENICFVYLNRYSWSFLSNGIQLPPKAPRQNRKMKFPITNSTFKLGLSESELAEIDLDSVSQKSKIIIFTS